MLYFPQSSSSHQALAFLLFLSFFFFFLGETPLKQEEDNCGVLAAPASLPLPAVQTPVQPGHTRELRIRLESETLILQAHLVGLAGKHEENWVATERICPD